VGYFSLRHSFYTGSGVHPASCRMGTGGEAAGPLKLTTCLHLVPGSKDTWSCTSTPPVHLHGVVL